MFRASSVVIVNNNDYCWRCGIDFRILNSVTKFDCFLPTRLKKALDAFAGATVFLSKLDLAITYNQLCVKLTDLEMTASITHVNIYKMLKMLLKLCNALLTYERLIVGVLQCLIDKICLAY